MLKFHEIFQKGVMKYFNIFMNFFLIFQSEIFHCASLYTVGLQEVTQPYEEKRATV